MLRTIARRGRRGDEDGVGSAEAGFAWAGHGHGGVLGLGVAAQVDFALERPRADAARERLEAGVLAAVRDEVRRLTEGLATLTTHVRLLTCDTSRNTFGNDCHRRRPRRTVGAVFNSLPWALILRYISTANGFCQFCNKL